MNSENAILIAYICQRGNQGPKEADESLRSILAPDPELNDRLNNYLMRFFVSNFKWVMLVSGLLTCTMFQALISPQASLPSNFGQTMEGSLAEIIVRNWGALIGLVGVMLIYGAFTEPVRRFVLVVAGSSKIIFILLVLSSKESFMGFGVGTAVIADSIMVALYIAYLLLTVKRSI